MQTVKAESSLASLKKLSGPEAKVLRDGVVVPIPSSEVTVGDIIMLEGGRLYSCRWTYSGMCKHEG